MLATTRRRRCALFAIAISAKAKIAPAHLAKDNALASNCDGEAVSRLTLNKTPSFSKRKALIKLLELFTGR